MGQHESRPRDCENQAVTRLVWCVRSKYYLGVQRPARREATEVAVEASEVTKRTDYAGIELRRWIYGNSNRARATCARPGRIIIRRDIGERIHTEEPETR